VINRFQRCIGVTLFRFGSWQLEAWCCPAGEVIPPHAHHGFGSRIIHLLGTMHWTMGGKSKVVTTWRCGWSKPVPAGVSHSAVAKSFSVFLNLERWQSKPTSASIDFHPA
jgi:hypothetical protein